MNMSVQRKTKLNKNLLLKVLIGLITVVLITLMFPKGESIESEVTEGSIWIHDDLIAPFSFPVYKDPDVYRAELIAAQERVHPVFIQNDNVVKEVLDSLKRYNTYLLNIIDSQLSGTLDESLNPTFLSTDAFNTFKSLRKLYKNQNNANGLKTIFSRLEKSLAGIYHKGIISQGPENNLKDSIAVRIGNVDRIEPISNYMNQQQALNELKTVLQQFSYSNELEKTIEEYGANFIRPNIIYSPDATGEMIEQARNNVSKYIGIVNENERIIAKHDRITKQAKLKIDSYKLAKGEMIGEEGILMQSIGKFLHILFLISLLVIYLFLFRKKIFFDNQKIVLISILFVLISFITFLINQVTVAAPLQLLIFIPAASMLVTIIFDSRLGFYSTVILALITGALRGNDYTFAAMNLFAGALSVYTVRDIKNRSQIFRSFLFILMGYVIAILAFGLERFASAENILVEMAFAGSNALISPVLTYGLLIFFERFFRITTDLTLLELSNFDRPLLKELARKAPGTFNHSMTMGTLAETAAEKVNANPLLARVGAYYHDIGKTIYPQNFVENQLNNQNIHENLRPEESVELIVKHVEEGISLAKENNLPEEIIDFIPAHHGTSVITFFYEKAKKLYGEENVDVEKFRYPGPKPKSKETAIVMLADGCESAVRAITEPDPSKVEKIISNIIKTRIAEGQLDDSPITFSDITKIKEAFLSILLGQHHRRIRYPKQDEIEKGSDTVKEKDE